MTTNDTEQEVIILAAAWAMIDDMVNFAHFQNLGERIHDINLIPKTSDTLRLFNLLLGDFLSPIYLRKGKSLPFGLPQPPSDTRPAFLTFLYYLKLVSKSPRFGTQAQCLSGPVDEFCDWLEVESLVENVWFPSIETEINLKIPRVVWIKICADMAKHAFPRLEINVGKIETILNDHGKSVEKGTGYLVLEEFWEWFHTNLFAYHCSTIAEHLNNIRWGIFNYLQPEFLRSFSKTNEISGLQMYTFDVPQEIENPIAKAMYWDLMNRMRSEPHFPQFTVTRSLKSRY